MQTFNCPKNPSRPVDFLLDAVSFLIIHSLVCFVINHAWSFIGLIFYFQIVKGEQTGVILILTNMNYFIVLLK